MTDKFLLPMDRVTWDEALSSSVHESLAFRARNAIGTVRFRAVGVVATFTAVVALGFALSGGQETTVLPASEVKLGTPVARNSIQPVPASACSVMRRWREGMAVNVTDATLRSDLANCR